MRGSTWQPLLAWLHPAGQLVTAGAHKGLSTHIKSKLSACSGTVQLLRVQLHPAGRLVGVHNRPTMRTCAWARGCARARVHAAAGLGMAAPSWRGCAQEIRADLAIYSDE